MADTHAPYTGLINSHDSGFTGLSSSRRRDCQLSSTDRATILSALLFCMAISDFEEASRVMKIISGEIDLQ
jgi:hypothetical protein